MLIKYDKADVLKEKNDFGVGKVENVKLIVLQSYDTESADLAFNDLSINSEKQAAHYAVDAEKVVKYAPSTTNLYDTSIKFMPLTMSLLPPKESTFMFDKPDYAPTQIYNNILKTFDNKPKVENSNDTDFRGNYINIVEICWGDVSNYAAVAKNLAMFLGQMIRDHGYKLENIWRAGDIIDYQDPEPELGQRNPYQYTHLKDWHSLLDAIDFCAKNPDTEPPASTFCFLDDDHMNVKRHCPYAVCDPEHAHMPHIHHWEADDRGISVITNSVDTQSSDMINEDFTSKTLNGSTFMQSNFQPDATQEFVQMESNYYEPIYPDLTCPPRNATSLYNIGIISSKQIIEKLTAADKKRIEKEIKTDLQIEGGNTSGVDNEYVKEKLKPVIGKIPNIFDPYPIDEKIAQLEFHAPMVTLEYEDAQNIQDNLTFYVLNRFINTEKRLVQLENIMTAQMRILNRLSSRIKINCVYYGGQSVFDKVAV